MKVKEYMISVYAVLVKNSKRDIESLPPCGLVCSERKAVTK